jgi:DNA-binding MarR family transcriptional regulator
MPDDVYLTRSLGFLLGDVSRLIRRQFDLRAEELGLTRAQWRVLAQLRRREGINQSALAELLEIEPITLVRHIDRLVAKGLVERRPDPNDRRAWKLHLADDVQPVLDRLRQLSEETRNEALAGIPHEQREQLIDNLLAMKANLTAMEYAEAAPPGKPRRAPAKRRSKVHGA